MGEQISFLDPEPLAESGQTVYLIMLDKIIRTEISEITTIGENADKYFVYRLKDVDVFNNKAVDENFGVKIFFDEKSAEQKLSQYSYPKINLSELNFNDILSYKYIRNMDGYELTAFLAKSGDNAIYEKDFYCYCFLRKYETIGIRDIEYKKMADKMLSEAKANDGTTNENPQLDNLYYVSENLYASEEYARRHTAFKA